MIKRFKDYVPVGFLFLLVLLSFFVLKPFLTSILMGALLAYMTYPMYIYLLSKVKSKTVSGLLVCTLVLLVFLVPGIFLVKTLVQESYVIFLLGKQKLATGIFASCENTFCGSLEAFANDPSVNFQVQEVLKAVTNWVIEKGSGFLLTVPGIILHLFVIFFTMFYFLRDGKKFSYYLSQFFSSSREKYDHITTRLKEVINGVIFGYLVVAFVQGTLGAFGFFLFGVSSPIFWGVVMALLALLPLIGTGFVWGPISIFMILDGVFKNSNSLIAQGVGLLIYSAIFVAGVDNLLRPKLMGDRAKVHPVLILLGTFGGLFFFGAVGVILGPLILALTVIMTEVFLEKGED